MDALVKSLYREGALQKTTINFFAACAKMDVAMCDNVTGQDGQETVSAAVLERALAMLEAALLWCDLNLLGTHDTMVFKSLSPTEIIAAGRTDSTIQINSVYIQTKPGSQNTEGIQAGNDSLLQHVQFTTLNRKVSSKTCIINVSLSKYLNRKELSKSSLTSFCSNHG